MEEDCVILDIPEGLRLNLLGLVVQIDRIFDHGRSGGASRRAVGVAHVRRCRRR